MIDNKTGRAQRLPKLALNEAIFCERDSARPTYYQLVTEDNYAVRDCIEGVGGGALNALESLMPVWLFRFLRDYADWN